MNTFKKHLKKKTDQIEDVCLKMSSVLLFFDSKIFFNQLFDLKLLF
jgi:hypothetical protein